MWSNMTTNSKSFGTHDTESVQQKARDIKRTIKSAEHKAHDIKRLAKNARQKAHVRNFTVTCAELGRIFDRPATPRWLARDSIAQRQGSGGSSGRVHPTSPKGTTCMLRVLP